jgi:hypothetical protein
MVNPPPPKITTPTGVRRLELDKNLGCQLKNAILHYCMILSSAFLPEFCTEKMSLFKNKI